MPANLERRLRLRMTLRQSGLLVIFAALAMWVITNEMQRGERPILLFLKLQIELPMILAPAMLLLMRRGPLKVWSLTLLCALPMLALLVGMNTLFWSGAVNLGPNMVQSLNFVVLVVCEVVMVVALGFLARLLIPKSCPLCRSRAMLRDPRVPRSSHFDRPTEPRLCLACGARFRRVKRGDWVDVDTIPGQPLPTDLAGVLNLIASKELRDRLNLTSKDDLG